VENSGVSVNCKTCAAELAPNALECANCHTLAHAEELEALAAQARLLESRGAYNQARELWLRGLPLLPSRSLQAKWIRDHALALERAAQASAPEQQNKWAKKLGPLGPIAVVLAKGKAVITALFKLKFLLSFAAFIGVYWALFGMQFGIGFAVLILLHEMGHFIDVKRRGLPAEMPVFLPGFGAYVKWQALGVSLETRAAISLAGPLAGCIAAAGCLALWHVTGLGVWAALARASAWLNVLNLIPVWVLDGGQAVLALSKLERFALMTASLALWLFFGENTFFLVALGALWRSFTKDAPAKPGANIIFYYIAVLTALGLVMWSVPGQGFGAP
jgi:Zn-dependent protease